MAKDTEPSKCSQVLGSAAGENEDHDMASVKSPKTKAARFQVL
jgi:hypothetical protein